MQEWFTNPKSKLRNSPYTYFSQPKTKSFKDADVNLVLAQWITACVIRMGKNAQPCADARTVWIKKGTNFTLKSKSRTYGRFPIIIQSE